MEPIKPPAEVEVFSHYIIVRALNTYVLLLGAVSKECRNELNCAIIDQGMEAHIHLLGPPVCLRAVY